MRALDQVAQKVLADIAAGRAPDKAYSNAMHAWYRKNAEDRPELSSVAEITFSMRASPTQSEIIEALILSRCPAETIEEAFSVPQEAVAWYAELFLTSQRSGQTLIGWSIWKTTRMAGPGI